MRAVDATDLGRVLLECHRTVYWKQAAKSHVRHFCNLGLLRPSTKVNLEPDGRWNTTSASSDFDFTVTTYHTTGDENQSRNDNAFCVRTTSLAILGHPNTSELALKPTV